MIGLTIVGHGLSSNTVVRKCHGNGCYALQINYTATVGQLKSLTDISASCLQHVKVHKELIQ